MSHGHSHGRSSSMDAGSGSASRGGGATTSTAGRTEDSEDPMTVVYKAIIDNPDFVNKLADVLRANPGGLRGPRGPTGASGSGATHEVGTHWRAEEVGFFFPDLHSSYGASDIVTIGKDSFYRNASVFIDRLDDIAKLKGGDIVRSNLPTCLRGAALQWYTTEVTEEEKVFFRSPSTTMNPQDPIHRWKVALRRRWDPPASVALKNFMTTQYTLSMAMSGVSMIQYFSTKLRLAKEAGFTDVHQQLLAVWNGLDIDIREKIPEPDDKTTIEMFRKNLEERERLWKEKLFRNRIKPSGMGTRNSGGFAPLGRDPAIRSNDRPWSQSTSNQGGSNDRPWSQAPNQVGPRYQGGNQGPRNRNDPASARVGPPQQRLQITGPQVKTEPSSTWTPGRRACSKCGGQHMDWEHSYYQNPANANRRPPRAYYLDVLQHGMESYTQDEVAECIAAYHAAESVSQPFTAAAQIDASGDMLQSVGGSNWFSDNSSWSYTDYDSEMENVTQYYHFADGSLSAKDSDIIEPSQMGYHLGEEKRDKGNGSRMVLPPRDLSDIPRTQVTRDVPFPDYVDFVDPSTCEAKQGLVKESHLGEERRDKGNRARMVLPPRDLSNVSRPQVARDVPMTDYVDKVVHPAPSLHQPAKSSTNKWACRQAECQMTFSSRNKLYAHLREKLHFAIAPDTSPPSGLLASPIIIKPHRKPHVGTGYAFRGYRYAEARVRAAVDSEDQWVCIDSGCGMTMADDNWLRTNFPEAHIARMQQPIKVQGIASEAHRSELFTVIKIMMPAVQQRKTIFVELEMEVHLVQGLPCKMLIGVDMLQPYGMSMDFDKGTLSWASEDISTEIRVKSSAPTPQQRKVKVSERVVVPPFSYRAIPVRFKPFPHRKEVGFVPSYHGSAYLAHSGAFLESVCSNETASVLFRNKTDRPVIMNRNLVIGEMREFDDNTECFHVGADLVGDLTESAFRAAERYPVQFGSPSAITGLHLSAEAMMGIGDRIPKSTQELVQDAVSDSILDDLGFSEISSSIDDIKYGPDLTTEQLQQLKDLVARHRAVWEKTDGVVNEPPEDWLQIRLKPGADLKSRGVYRLGRKDRELVDELFDKLTREGKMTRTRSANPVGWGVFVVRSGKPGDKGRVVVDTRGLNAATEDDAYPLPRQEDVMARIRWNLLISLLDQIKSYYQRIVHPKSRKYTTVVSHRGQEEYGVVLMGYKGSPAHQQRYMDEFLLEFIEWACCYIDDIIVASKSFEHHLAHLEALFSKMEKANLALNPKKCRIAFRKIELLGHVVDQFGVYTLEAKTAAIRNMAFPTTLAELEYFLGLTGYYRQFVEFYALKAAPLRKLATDLTKGIRKENQKRAVKADSVKVPPPSDIQMQAFNQLKEALSTEQFLIHDDCHVPLLMSVDASYDFGFGVTVYQVPALTMEEKNISVEQIQEGNYDRRLDRVVMFLSKELTTAETVYWPTELETAALVFAVKKTRHLVEANDFPAIVYTDHVAVKHVAHAKSLKTTSPERANMRLIRASQYLSQFRLDVRYRPGKENVAADALSRLKQVPTKTDIFTVTSDIIPDSDRTLGTYSLIQMSPELVLEWSTALQNDKHYKSIFADLTGKLGDSDEVEAYGWVLKKVQQHPLLFVRKGDQGGIRACVPTTMAKTVLKAAHDLQAHAGIQNTFAAIRDHFYIPRMSALVRSYVSACPECARKRTALHKPYGLLQPIEPPAKPFDMITIDFVVKLPLSRSQGELYDTILTITDKVSKAVIFAPGKETWNADIWADVLLKEVVRRWGLPLSIISDRGSIFVSELWKQIFKKLGVSLLFSTAYHPQTDGQSEATNKYLQTMLRFFVNERQDDWSMYLGEAEAIINNSNTASMKMSPNEILYGFKLRNTISALAEGMAPQDTESAPIRRSFARSDAEDSSKHATFHIARDYNKKHKQMSFKVGDMVYLRIGNGYKLRGIPKAKLGLQRVGPFAILSKVGSHAYELELPQDWTIHPVVSIAQLEPFVEDSFNRVQPPPPPVTIEGEEEYEIEAVVKSAMRGKGRNRRLHYLLRWKGYGPEYDTWVPEEDMEHARELVDDFVRAERDKMEIAVVR
jgi:transposase InsO family protein